MTAPSSPALSEDSDPPNLPTAVRIGATMAARRRVIGSISILGDADDTGIDQAGKLGARQRQALRQYFLAMLAVARCGARRLAFPLRQGRKGARGGIGETAGIVGVAEERIVGDERRVLDQIGRAHV